MSEKKRGKGWMFAILAVVAALVGGAVFVVGDWFVQSNKEAVEHKILRDRYSDDPLKYEKLGPPYFYRLTLWATVDGAPVEIDQIGECRPFLASGGMGAGYTFEYELIPKYAGQRLPDGSAFYIRMPSYCFTLRGENKAVRWAAQGTQPALPQGFWVDSLENTTVIEMYVTARYFEEPEARIRIEEGSVEFLESGVTPAAQKASSFATLDRPHRVERQPDGQDDSRSKTPRSWQLRRVGRDLSTDFPAQPLAVSEKGRFKVFDVSHAPLNQYYNSGASARLRTKLYAGLPLDFPENLMETWDVELVRIGEDMNSEMIPLRWSEGRYHALAHPTGYVLWQNAVGQDPLRAGGAVTIIIDGDPVNINLVGLKVRQVAFLDTWSKKVYVLRSWY